MSIHENWKKIEGFDNYSVSDLGNLRNDKTGRILNGKPDNYGYKHVVLRNDGKSYSRKVHRLVATTFIPNPQNKPLVDHFNEDKTDNRVCNLRWVTYKENLDAYLDRRERKRGRKVKKVAQYNINGDLIAVYKNCRDASNKTGSSYYGIHNAVVGRMRTCNNYVWRYFDDEPAQHIDFILDARLTRVIIIDGNDKKEFNSVKNAASYIETALNVKNAYPNIMSCLQGKTKTAYGYKFEYI